MKTVGEPFGRQKSDCLVVAMKSVKADGAKGAASIHFLFGETCRHRGHDSMVPYAMRGKAAQDLSIHHAAMNA